MIPELKKHAQLEGCSFDEFPVVSNGAHREHSEEMKRGKKPTTPFMHFSGLAQDYQPVIDGKMVSEWQLKDLKYEEYNMAMADAADDAGLTPGFRFSSPHPEHFEDRDGKAYSRALQEEAESGARGRVRVRDKTMSGGN